MEEGVSKELRVEFISKVQKNVYYCKILICIIN